tara:strand:+ start:340 stop:501 length:162 start_codon:yes stop_codon:yes gene_type:complete
MDFSVKMTVNIDEEDNLLPALSEMYEEAVKEIVEDIVYDIDGATLKNIEVKQR